MNNEQFFYCLKNYENLQLVLRIRCKNIFTLPESGPTPIFSTLFQSAIALGTISKISYVFWMLQTKPHIEVQVTSQNQVDRIACLRQQFLHFEQEDDRLIVKVLNNPLV